VRKKYLVLLLFVMLSASGAGLDFEIKQECNNEASLFSLYSKEGGNAGMPGYYKWQVCGDQVEYAEFRAGCNGDELSALSFFKRNDSHVSSNNVYGVNVCTPRVKTSINETCENPIVSLHSRTDSHVAEPGYYENQLCGELEDPDNVSVELSLNAENVYVDGEEAEERVYNPIELNYPYMVSEDTGIVNYGNLLSLEYSSGSSEVLEITQQDRGNFLLPLTGDMPSSIDRREDMVTERIFLNQMSPSFNYPIYQDPMVKVAYQPEYEVDGFEGSETERVSLAVRNGFTEGNNTLLNIIQR